MKPPLPFLTAATVVFLAAGLFHKARSGGIAASRDRSHPAEASSADAALKESASASPKPVNAPAPPVRPEPAEGALIDRVERKLRASVKPETLADMVAWTDHLTLASIRAAVVLSPEEAAKLKEHLASLRLDRNRNSLRVDLTAADRIATETELTRAHDAWLKEFLGEERFAKYEASEKAAKQADAERAASRGLARISQDVPLRPEQKDALYDGLLSAAAAPPPPSDPLVRFRVTSTISHDPPAPAIGEGAKAILTPEQWTAYEEQTRIATEGQSRMTNYLMSMMPMLLSSLQELIDESPAAERDGEAPR